MYIIDSIIETTLKRPIETVERLPECMDLYGNDDSAGIQQASPSTNNYSNCNSIYFLILLLYWM